MIPSTESQRLSDPDSSPITSATKVHFNLISGSDRFRVFTVKPSTSTAGPSKLKYLLQNHFFPSISLSLRFEDRSPRRDLFALKHLVMCVSFSNVSFSVLEANLSSHLRKHFNTYLYPSIRRYSCSAKMPMTWNADADAKVCNFCSCFQSFYS